ncbi:hypothetical protein QBC39DRAFT_33 [Podospora conica]|nr:hypothetical protein QBC39DRAFT_33 [Schizothecium conicum]
MKYGLVYHLAAVAGLVSGRAVASTMDDAGISILGSEHFARMALLPRQSVSNLQVFGGALGSVAASPITKTEEIDRPFGVDGSTFRDFNSAANRACDNQFNQCAAIANRKGGNFEVGDCDKQNSACKSAAQQQPSKAFPPPVFVSSTAEFDFFCDT